MVSQDIFLVDLFLSPHLLWNQVSNLEAKLARKDGEIASIRAQHSESCEQVLHVHETKASMIIIIVWFLVEVVFFLLNFCENVKKNQSLGSLCCMVTWCSNFIVELFFFSAYVYTVMHDCVVFYGECNGWQIVINNLCKKVYLLKKIFLSSAAEEFEYSLFT